jgi:hypothetical protein
MRYLFTIFCLLLSLSFTGCGSAASPAQPVPAAETAPVEPEVAAENAPAAGVVEIETQTESGESAAVANLGPAANRPNVYNRLIIKNAEIEMTVENTDTAINRSLGIVTEYGGYVVSNRTWFNQEYKYATLSIGVPAENFEEMLRRLKDLAVTVTNETVSGQDVTEEFVDLESRLRNLEATAARIREFLEMAQDVEESLQVNAQLATIEAEIEQVKGRMTYLRDRAAFSTITLTISPQIAVPTPTPSPTPEPWSAASSFTNATQVTSNTARVLFQVSVDLLIWLVVVILPFTLPIIGLILAGIWLIRRLAGRQAVPPASS